MSLQVITMTSLKKSLQDNRKTIVVSSLPPEIGGNVS